MIFMIDKNAKSQFMNPIDTITNLKRKYNCPRAHLLPNYLRNSNCKHDRESFFAAIFAESLNKISTQKHMIYVPEEELGYDYQLLNYSVYQENQELSKNKRKYDHFFIENVCITSHVIEKKIKNNIKNISEIFCDHLTNKKLSIESGDYKGYILVFYISLKINGFIGLKEIRENIRKITQDKFQQIWIIVPNHDKYGIAELLESNEPYQISDFYSV